MKFGLLAPAAAIFWKYVANWRQIAVGAGIAVMLAACAGVPAGGGVAKDAPADARKAAVTERVNARWAALIKGDLEGAYRFLSPASREVTTLEQFRAKTRSSGFREAAVEKVDCEAEICRILLRITYDHRLMRGIVTPIEETWVLEQGQYWLVYRG